MFKILIADDNYEDRELLKLEIERALGREEKDLRFYEAPSVKQAKELLKSQLFDLLTLDIEFDKMNEGIDVLPEIFETYPTLNIIIISGRLKKSEVSEELFRFTKENILKGKRWARHFDVLDKKDDKTEALKRAYSFVFRQKDAADKVHELFLLAESSLEKGEMDKCLDIYQKIQSLAPGEHESDENINLFKSGVSPEQALDYFRKGEKIIASLLLGHFLEIRLKIFTKKTIGRSFPGLYDCLKELERTHRLGSLKKDLFHQVLRLRNKAIHHPTTISEQDFDIAVKKMKIRNATVTTIAPTGTLSIIAGASSGIEPLFAVSYVRTVMEGTRLIEVNPQFEKVARERGFWNRELMEKIAEKGTIKDFKEIPDDVKAVFVTAHDITPEEHIKMQAAFQKYIDNAVSKTVNFSHEATPKDVEDVYLLAYKLGCKGVTVYRDGSREEQVLSTGKSKEIKAQEGQPIQKIVPRKRPSMIKGATRLMKTGCGHLYITVNEDEKGHLFELFTSMGKAGGCAASQSEAIGRLVSLAFRSNIDPDEVINQLKGISCHQPSWAEGGRILSCSDAIAKAIDKYRTDGKKGNGNGHKDDEIMLIGACPECGGAVEHEGGCAVCHNCGFTKCG